MKKRHPDISLQGSLQMTVGNTSLGGPERVTLLAQIGECGSITGAAKAVGMSYKAAWDAIDAMNNLAGEPLVQRSAGGKGGGGTRLTARGQRLVANFGIIEQAHRRYLATLGQQAGDITQDYLLIRRMALQTSARNQLAGRISRITHGAVNDEIELQLPGGVQVIAIITCQSTRALALEVGVEALALVKASSVILVKDAGVAGFSARNQLAGTVSRVRPGVVNAEVVLELAGGMTITAIITRQSCTALGLAAGQQATALVKASNVILATPA